MTNSTYIETLKKTFTFSGRAGVREFNSFIIMNLVALTIVFIIAMSLDSRWMIEAYTAFAFITLISLTVRRLHDIDKSGWWILIALIPFGVVYLYFLCYRPGTGDNRFGSPVG